MTCLEFNYIFQFIIVYSEILFSKGLHSMEIQSIDLQSKSIDRLLDDAIFFSERYFLRRIEKWVERPERKFVQKYLAAFGRWLFFGKALSRMFD